MEDVTTPTGADNLGNEVEEQNVENVATEEVIPEPQPEKTFTQKDVDRLISERLQRERSKAEKAASAANEEAERKRLEEQNEFKALYEKVQADNELMKAETAKAARLALVTKVSYKHGLPEVLANRLSGETEEELEADALLLKGTLGSQKPVKPDIAGVEPVKAAGITDDDKKMLREKFGINWR